MLFCIALMPGCSGNPAANADISPTPDAAELQKQLQEANDKIADLQYTIDNQQREIDNLQSSIVPSPAETPRPSQLFLWSALEEAFDALNDSPGKYPIVDDNFKGKDFIFTAVKKYYDGIMTGVIEENKKKDVKVFYSILKVDDFTEDFKKLYGSTEYYDKNAYYCKAYVLAVEMSPGGEVNKVFDDFPRELTVYKYNGEWIAEVARG
jgi:hypothetical protein